MPGVCLYFQLHQPLRLGDMGVLDVGKEVDHFSHTDKHNRKIFRKVARKSYVPMLTLLKQLTTLYPNFKCSFSASGIFLEQAKEFYPEVIDLLVDLVNSQQVEILAETYYHSLASLYSPSEFRVQIHKHRELVRELFGVEPKVFRNTELIYSNDIAKQVSELGYIGMLTEAVERYLGDGDRTKVHVDTQRAMPLLLKHAQLSDDVAFRFSDRSWKWYPLDVRQYLGWFEVYPTESFVNLFMDFETFGEHQWEDTGIFEFFAEFVQRFLQGRWNRFVLPSEVFEDEKYQSLKSLPIYDVPEPISWADVDRDLTAWIDNPFQQDTLRVLYELEDRVLSQNNPALLDNWRKLQTSDHFYYMCTKWAADGDVHAYFSPFESPQEAYRQYCIALADLSGQLTQ